MPKITTIVEYSLLDALKVISKVEYSVNGNKNLERFNIDDISCIKRIDKIYFTIEHKNKAYQIKLNSTIAILIGGVK